MEKCEKDPKVAEKREGNLFLPEERSKRNPTTIGEIIQSAMTYNFI